MSAGLLKKFNRFISQLFKLVIKQNKIVVQGKQNLWKVVFSIELHVPSYSHEYFFALK